MAVISCSTGVVAIPKTKAAIVILPSHFDGLKLWLKSDTGLYQDSSKITPVSGDGDPVGAWADQSGNGLDVLQATVAEKPVYKTDRINGEPSVLFASGDNLQASLASDWKFLHDGGDFWAVVVYRTTAAKPDAIYVLLDSCSTSSANIGFGTWIDDRTAQSRDEQVNVAINRGVSGFSAAATLSYEEAVYFSNWHIGSGRRTSGGDLWLENDGHWGGDQSASYDYTPSTGNPQGALTVGATINNTFNLVGDVVEVILYDATISAPNRQRIYDYLTYKYAFNNIYLFGDESELTSGTDSHGFGSIVIAGNGDLVIGYRVGATHASTDGEIIVIVSDDQGVTWSSESIELTSASWDYRYAGLTLLADGTLMMLVGRRDNTGTGVTNGVTVITSTDDGANWGSETVVTNNYTDWVREGGRVIELDNGDLLCPMYGADTGDGTTWRIRVSKSTDGGTTWAHLANIATGTEYSESGLVLLNNSDILCLIRDSNSDIALKTISTDSGATWGSTSTISDYIRGLKNPTLLSDGGLVGIDRDVTDGSTRILYSSDEGGSWQLGHLLPESSAGTFMIYGNADEDDDYVYVMYATEDAIQEEAHVLFIRAPKAKTSSIIINANAGVITATGQQARINIVVISASAGTVTATGQQAIIDTPSKGGSKFPANLLGV